MSAAVLKYQQQYPCCDNNICYCSSVFTRFKRDVVYCFACRHVNFEINRSSQIFLSKSDCRSPPVEHGTWARTHQLISPNETSDFVVSAVSRALLCLLISSSMLWRSGKFDCLQPVQNTLAHVVFWASWSASAFELLQELNTGCLDAVCSVQVSGSHFQG